MGSIRIAVISILGVGFSRNGTQAKRERSRLIYVKNMREDCYRAFWLHSGKRLLSHHEESPSTRALLTPMQSAAGLKTLSAAFPSMGL